MFDLTPLARIAGWLLPIYLLAFPVLAILFVSLNAATGADTPNGDVMGIYPPILFALVAIVLAYDFHRRLRSAQLTTTQVSGYRFVGVLCMLGAAFGLAQLSHGATWIPVAVAAVSLAAMCRPTKSLAVPSAWTPK